MSSKNTKQDLFANVEAFSANLKTAKQATAQAQRQVSEILTAMPTGMLVKETLKNALPSTKVAAQLQGGTVAVWATYCALTASGGMFGAFVSGLTHAAVGLGIVNIVKHNQGELEELVLRRLFSSKGSKQVEATQTDEEIALAAKLQNLVEVDSTKEDVK